MSNKNLTTTQLFNCPECQSSDTLVKFFVPVSHYGHLPSKPKDVCKSCGFQSQDTFYNLNKIKLRNEKLTKILEDGI